MKVHSESVPVIDLFAGPGGLGEGFSAYFSHEGRARYRLVLSIEKNENAHRTLELRAFFRQFTPGAAPDEYYAYLRGDISRQELVETVSGRKPGCLKHSVVRRTGKRERSSTDCRPKNQRSSGGARHGY